MVEVTAGIIIKDNKILIAQQGLDKKFGGRWELPGGKLEQGETLEECIRRELKEELDILIQNQEYFIANDHEYENLKVRIYSFLIKEYEGEIKLNEHEDTKWIDSVNYDDRDILEADLPFIEAIPRNI